MRPTLAIAGLLLAHGALASPPPFVDYVHVEANEGGSSGGHVAIRFGEETYHFQHERPGVLRLRRDDWQHFRYAYGVLENRTMHVSGVAVSPAIYAQLRQRFNERYLRERKVFEHRDTLRDDLSLLELLLARRQGDAGGTIRVRGAGFFFPVEGRSGASLAALALRRRVQQTYGPDVIGRRMEEVRGELLRLAPAVLSPPTGDIPPDGYPDFGYPYSSRYRDLLTALIALHALDHALPLRPGSYWSSPDADLDLDAAARRRVAAYADRLTDQLTRLFSSDRPDWGFAFLIGMARLEALRASSDTGRLVLLDAFPPEHDVVPRSYLRQHRDTVVDLRADARDELARARAGLRAGGEIHEAGFAEVEAAGNRLLELEAALTEHRDLRVSAGALLPSLDAPWPDLVVPEVTADELGASVERARAAKERFTHRLQQRFGYDLIRRNCVSEIFRTVDPAGAGPGGHVGTRWSLDFIPFVSARSVNGEWNVVQRTTLASYRRSRLDDMYQRENPLRAWLRECNVLTSTIYRRNADDSFFLLFTDDILALRPVFGAGNLAAALAAAAVGLPLLPLDRGHLLTSGVRGALFSLPELAFVSLRKGSFDYVRREQRRCSPPAAWPGGDRGPSALTAAPPAD